MATLITNNVSDIGSPVNYQLMRGLLSAARKKLPYFNGTVPGVLTKNMGAPAVIWQRVDNLAAVTTAISEPPAATSSAWQNGRTLVKPTVATVTATPLKYGNAIQTTEEIDLIQMNARSMQFMDTLGANAGESLNELMIDTYQSVTTTSLRQAAGVASAAAIITKLSVNDVKWAVNQLNRNSAMNFTPIGTGSQNYNSQPIRDAYYGICHPDVEEDVRDGAGFIGVEQYAGYTDTLPGEFGTLRGVRFCTSELAGVIEIDGGGAASTNSLRFTSSGAACDVYDTFIYGREAIGTVGLGEQHTTSIQMMYDVIPTVELIQHLPGSAGSGDPYNEIGTVAWKAWQAGAVLNNGWVMRLRSGASDLS
jgi:N4-gp56 family major capsid protein